MSRRGRALAWIAAALAAVLAAQVWLPDYVARRVARTLAAAVPEHERITVEVASLPAVRLLGGWIDAAAVDLVGPRLGGLKLEWVALRGRGVQVDVPALREGRLHVRKAETLRVEAAVGEEALAAYIAAALPEVAAPQVRLRAGQVELAAGVPVLGWPAPVAVTGRVEAAGQARLRFVPEAITFAGEAVSGYWLELLRTVLAWEVDLGFLPFPVAVDEVKVTDGRMIARGRWREE